MTDASKKIDEKYCQQSGRAFLSGNQALVRLVLEQSRRDEAAGMNTGGFISGYRVDKNDPPVLLIHGTLDSMVPVQNSDAMSKTLKEAGVPYTYDRIEGWFLLPFALPVRPFFDTTSGPGFDGRQFCQLFPPINF